MSIFILLSNVSMAQNNIDISGFARTYEGFLTDNGNMAISQQTMNLNFSKMGNKGALVINPMAYLYDTDSLVFRMREIYLDLYTKNFDLRLGKQQIVWGKADGVFITDIVSPLNLSEFLLPDFDEIRIGVISAKLDYYIGTSTLEFIAVPVFQPNITPQPGSIWYISPDFPVQPQYDLSKENVTPSLENTEIFLKYSGFTSKLDYEIMGAYTWDDYPSLYVSKDFDSITHQLSDLTITPEYKRLGVAGASFSATLGSFILRTEGAWYTGKSFQTEDMTVTSGLVEKDYLHYVVGLDYSLGNLRLSSQFIQKSIFNYEPDILDEETENTMTFLASYNAMRETLHLELFSYVGLEYGDALIRPTIIYDIEDAFSVKLGANIFVGDERGTFGRYDDNTMVYAKVKYNF